MLQHVVETQVLNLVFARVDLLVRVLKVRLDHKRRRIPGFGSGGVVGAGVSAFRQHIRDGAVLLRVSHNGIETTERHQPV